MKTAFFCLPLLTAILHAQPVDNAGIVVKMTTDLLPLKSAMPSSEPLKDDVFTRAELESLVKGTQRQIIQSWQEDLSKVQARYIRSFRKPGDSPWEAPSGFWAFSDQDQAYKLTSVLAGRDLSEENLRPLVEGIVGMAESAMESRNTSSPLRDSATFHSSAEKVGAALQALGVSNADIRVVGDSLFAGAERAATPPIRTTYK
jgi:hypothetical protein